MRSGLILLVSNLVAAFANLIRNILAARLLDVEDFGIANTFTIMIILMNIVFATGIGTYLLQAKDGDETRIQNTLQSLHILQGFIAAAFIGLMAVPYARFMGAEEATWGFFLLAIVGPLLGFNHLDYYRQMRESRFNSTALVSVAPLIISTLAVWPLFEIFGDWRTMLWVLIIQMATGLVVTHLVAERPFRLATDRPVVQKMMRFGLPLLGDSLLFVLILNADRMIVANRFGPEMLAWFSVAFMLAVLPVSVLTRSLQTVFLAKLVNRRDTPDSFEDMGVLTCQVLLAAGVLLAGGIMVFGPAVVGLLYGERYAQAVPFLLFLGVMQGVRLARVGPLTIGLAHGNSHYNLISSAVRAVFILIAAVAAYSGAPIPVFLAIGVFGEVCATATAYFLVWRHNTLSGMVTPLALSVLIMIPILWEGWIDAPRLGLIDGLNLRHMIVAGLALVFLAGLKTARSWLLMTLATWKARS